MRSAYILRKIFKESYKPFLYFLADRNDLFLPIIPFSPTTASINMTNRCNSRCITCNMWRHKHDRSAEELTTAELIDILAQLKDTGVIRINLLGGEPLLRPDLPDIIRSASGMGFDYINIVTNGLLLSKGKIEELVAGGLTGISISIDGIGDTNDYCRGIKGSFEKNINNVFLIKKEFPHLDLHVLTTLMRPTLDDVIDLVTLCEKLNVRWFMNLLDTSPFFFNNVDTSSLEISDKSKSNEVIRKLHKIKRTSTVIDPTITHEALEFSRNYFMGTKKEKIPCIMGFSHIYINAFGELYSGCWALNNMGNLREAGIKEILNSRKYRKRLEDMFKNRCPGCSCGYQLNILYDLPSISKEFLWLIGVKR